MNRRQTWARSSSNPTGKRRASQAAREISSALFDQGGELKLGRKHRPDYLMVILILALGLFGLIILFSIAPAITAGDDSGTTAFMLRQGAYLAVGLTAFFVVGQIPLDFWRKWGAKLFVLALILCFVVPILGKVWPAEFCSLGACRWIRFAGFSFQPAELLKFATVLFLSGFFAIRAARNELGSARKTFWPLLIMTLLALFIIVVLQKDLGTGIALAAVILVQMIVANLRWKQIAIWLAILGVLGISAIALFPHRMDRIATFFGGGTAETDYHINQALIALGSGGLTGRGLGQSVQAFGWLPEAENDSILPVIGESLGFIGILAVLAAFAALFKRIIAKIDFTENMFLRLILAGVFAWLFAHVVLNVGSMTHLVPLTGVTLPLLSLGGTSILFVMSSLGLVFAISRYTTHRKIKAEEGGSQGENSLRGRRQWRPHYADRSGR